MQNPYFGVVNGGQEVFCACMEVYGLVEWGVNV